MAPRKSPELTYVVRNPCGFYTPIPACALRYSQAEQLASVPQRQLKAAGPIDHWCWAARANIQSAPPRAMPTYKGRRQPVMKPAPTGHGAFVRDAIEEGQDLAVSSLVLPAKAGFGPSRAPQGTYSWGRPYHFEEDVDEWLEPEGEVAAGGLVAHGADFSMGCLPRSEETYTIRTKARKRRSVPDFDEWDVVSVASACDFVKV